MLTSTPFKRYSIFCHITIFLSQAPNPGKQCDTSGGQSNNQPDSDGQDVEN